MARVAAITRRHGRQTTDTDASPGVLVVEGLRLDRDRREQTVRNEPVELTKQEFDVLLVTPSGSVSSGYVAAFQMGVALCRRLRLPGHCYRAKISSSSCANVSAIASAAPVPAASRASFEE